MKVLILAGLMAIVASDASATSRYQTMQLSCVDVQEIVQEEGTAILRWRSRRNPSLPIYGKYVSDSRFCESNEVATFATVPTKDMRSCAVRKCIQREPLGRFGRNRIWIPN
jgi:hypothetical protein